MSTSPKPAATPAKPLTDAERKALIERIGCEDKEIVRALAPV